MEVPEGQDKEPPGIGSAHWHKGSAMYGLKTWGWHSVEHSPVYTMLLGVGGMEKRLICYCSTQEAEAGRFLVGIC